MLPYYDYDDDVLFLEELVQSNQAKYIQHLHLQEVIPLPLIKLKHMETLHTLRIDCGGWRRDSDYYRKKTINFICSDLPLNPTCINYLELTSVDLTWDLAKIIETIFPKLSTLILQGNLNNNLEISLPNRNLEKVSIITVVTEVLWHGFVIKTTNDGTLQYHAPRKVPDSFRYDGIPVMKEEFNALFVLTLALL
jgi:hypothetical protein